jgi:hypothetical protein
VVNIECGVDLDEFEAGNMGRVPCGAGAGKKLNAG